MPPDERPPPDPPAAAGAAPDGGAVAADARLAGAPNEAVLAALQVGGGVWWCCCWRLDRRGAAATRTPRLLPQARLAALNRPRPAPSAGQAPKDKYMFWETQPVVQFSADAAADAAGPIDAPKSVADVRPDPLPLPAGFAWATVDVTDAAQVESLHSLLHSHYVEDDDEAFRFDYSAPFLAWALTPPGHVADWHVGIKAAASGRLVAFISGVPAQLSVAGGGAGAAAATLAAAEVNFLCVHKKLRAKRLAPVLIKELTRRINLKGVWQAAYTAGVVLPSPVATARYWHRSLNVRKLVEVGFTCLPPRQTLARAVKLHRLPAAPATPGLTVMVEADVPGVAALLNARARAHRLAPVFTEQEVAHYMLPRAGVVHTHVARNGSKGAVSDVASFYTLPSTVVRRTGGHDTLVAAFQWYTVATSVPEATLTADALGLARDAGHDVFNCLDISSNAALLADLKFAPGDGRLRYYLYNWRVAGGGMEKGDVGLIML